MDISKEKQSLKKVAVVGGGIFGVTTAVRLARDGHSVELFEREPEILRAASGINQLRLHRGYHYLRSAETTIESIRTEISFRREYGDAIIDSGDQYYCIAKEGSLVSPEQFIGSCTKFGLHFRIVRPDFLNYQNIALCLQVHEGRIDPIALRRICTKRLKQSGVKVHLNNQATPEIFDQFDFVVICAYANTNRLLSGHPHEMGEYQFELCEKPIVVLPRSFLGKGIVVVDGPFMCVDPFGQTGKFLLGNVVHAIHQTNIGIYPECQKELYPLLNKGIVKKPAITNFKKFIESASQFIPALAGARHVGSMYTFRTVFPHRDATDERPTIVKRIGRNIITVFAGKFSNCAEAADRVSNIVAEIL